MAETSVITVRLHTGQTIARKARLFDDGRKAEVRHNNGVIVAYLVSWLKSGYVWIDKEMYADYMRDGDPELNAVLSEQEKALAADGAAFAAQVPAGAQPYEEFVAVPFSTPGNHAALGTPFRNAQGETIAEFYDKQAQARLQQPGDFSIWYTFRVGGDDSPFGERQACLTLLEAPSGEAAREAFNHLTDSPTWKTMEPYNVAVFPGRDPKAKLALRYAAIMAPAAPASGETAQGEEIAPAAPAAPSGAGWVIRAMSLNTVVKEIPDDSRLHARVVARSWLGTWLPIERLGGQFVKVNRVLVVAPSGAIEEDLTTKPEPPRAPDSAAWAGASYDKNAAYAHAAQAADGASGVVCEVCGDLLALGGFFHRGKVYCAGCSPEEPFNAFLAARQLAQESEAQ